MQVLKWALLHAVAEEGQNPTHSSEVFETVRCCLILTLKIRGAQVLAAANMLLLDELKAECEVRLTKSVTVDNCCALLQSADTHEARALRSHCLRWARNVQKKCSSQIATFETGAVVWILVWRR